MGFDGLFLHYLIKELNESILNNRLEKIIQTNDEMFVFSFYYAKNRKYLKINLNPSNYGLFISNNIEESKITNQFLLILKKNLEGSILKEIKQYQTDRVVIFTFIVSDLIEGLIEKHVIVELMGRHSNLFLVQNNTIIDCYKKMFSVGNRHLIPKANFEFFKSNQKPFTEFSLKGIEAPKDIYLNFMGLSPLVSNYLFNTPIDLEKIVLQPTLNLSKKDFYLFDLFNEDDDKEYFDSLSFLLEFLNLSKEKQSQKETIFIEQLFKKTIKKQEALFYDLEKAKENLISKEEADLIYQSGLPLENKYSNINVNGKDLSLDANYSLNEIAQQKYQIYKKAKRSVLFIEEQIEEVKLLLDQINDLKVFSSISNSKKDLEDLEKDLIPLGYKVKNKKPKTKKQEKPNIKQIILDDAIIFIGKNHLQNAYLTHEIANNNDYFFHVKDAPGSHLILRCEKMTEELLRLAAMLAAYYSNYRHSSSIPVDYTMVKNVKKIPKLPHYQVRYSNYQTFYIDINPEYLKNFIIL